LHSCRHVGNELHAIAGRLACDDPNGFIRFRTLCISLRALRMLATMALQAQMSRQDIRRRLLGCACTAGVAPIAARDDSGAEEDTECQRAEMMSLHGSAPKAVPRSVSGCQFIACRAAPAWPRPAPSAGRSTVRRSWD